MPTAWDRLQDATTPESVGDRLSIVTLGHVHTADLDPLTTKFAHLEQLVLDVAPRDPLAQHRAEFNRAVDAASNDWILIVRERETIDESLAQEIAAATRGGKARGFRIRTVFFYAGKPLRIAADEGEVRLFHRRYYLRYADKGQWTKLAIQGTVVWLEHFFRLQTFADVAEHREFLAKGKRRGVFSRVAVFLRDAVLTGAVDANTLRYIWTESGAIKE